MKNSELLKTSNRNFTPEEKQHRYVLGCLVQKNSCPNCRYELNFFEAIGVDIDDWKDKVGADFCRCTACKRELTYTVPAIATTGNGGWHWLLVPIKSEK